MAEGSVISSHLRRKNRSHGAFAISKRLEAAGSTAGVGRGASDAVRRLRSPDGKPFNALKISARPRRSAIRMVAELKPLVDSSNS